MNVIEMKKEIDEYCGSRTSCNDIYAEGECPLHCPTGCSMGESDEDIIKAFHKLYGEPTVEEPAAVEPDTKDVINHPNHYCREGAVECIDEMIMIFGKEVVKHFCLCNIWKYRYRSAAKNGEEDIKKSDRYVQIYKELCSNER